MRKIRGMAKRREGEATSARIGFPVVRPAGIEPATLSLEVRFRRAVHNKFNAFGLQDEAECDRFIPSHAPPAHYSVTLRDPYAN